MNRSRIKLWNGTILTDGRQIDHGFVLIEDGKIIAVEEKNTEITDAIDIDVKGRYITPGFIDMHVHGGGGHDFMDGEVKAFLEIARTHARYGTTALMPTTLTASRQELERVLSVYKTANDENKEGAQFLGMHLEGPYLNPVQRGAQDARYLRDPDPAEYKEWISAYPFIKRWDAAPELEGALPFGKYLADHNILASMAHTNAIYEEVAPAFRNGYTLATHLYSAMSGVTRRNAYRYAGVVESAFLIDEMDVEIIADGIHLPAPLLQLVYKIKGADRTALITDAMRGAGHPAGESILGSKNDGIKVIIEDGIAKLPDRTAFAGSVATADRLVRTMVTIAGIPLKNAVQMITATPARILGITDKKGSLKKGRDADLVILNEDITVFMTISNGRIIYQKETP